MNLTVENLSFAYSSSLALNNVNFTVKKGETLGIIGSNGSGKSTLIRCLNNILKPHKGTVKISGNNISKQSHKEISRLAGYVPQDIPSGFSATVFDTILMGRKPYFNFFPCHNDLEKTASLISKLNLDNISGKAINQISGGERQKVFVARAVAQEPEVMLLDEPTANLDIKHQLETLNLIKDVSSKGISIIIAIHDINLAARFCDKFIMLKKGQIHDAGSKKILNKENIKEVYDIKADIISNENHFIIVPRTL
ncbi:MAG: ABC transporter ATP-binding protein [Nanobdellota archaeon]